MRDQDFRDLMAAVCAPVTVVTTVDEDGPHGTTVSAFASLSLHPPLVTVALDQHSALLTRIQRTGRLGINVLGSADDELALRFALSRDRLRGTDRFAGVGWSLAHGLPRLDGAAGWAACELRQTVDGGDHRLLIALVGQAESHPVPPLVYGHRTFGTHSRFASRPRPPVAELIAAFSR